MPRKQRFKPSRKPKPSPQTEETMIGHPVSSTASDADRVEASTSRDAGRDDGDDRAPTETETDQRSR
jgi:hypothetical protein